MVMLGEVEACERVMLAPATKANAVDDAVLTVPDVAPTPAAIVDSTVPTPDTVTLGLVEFWDSVMLAPAINPHAVEDAVFTVPEVAPAPAAIVRSTD
jgi:hypothetical protein